MSVLDRIPEIAERRAAARKNAGKKTGSGSSESIPVLAKGKARGRPEPQPSRDKSTAIAAKSGTSGVSIAKPKGFFARLSASLQKTTRRQPIPDPSRNRLVEAGAGIDSFFSGKGDPSYKAFDLGGPRAPSFNGRSLESETSGERRGRVLDAMAFNLFEQLDVNGDGVLSWEELRPLRDAVSLDDLDMNRDSHVSWREFSSNYQMIDGRARETFRDTRETEEKARDEIAERPIPVRNRSRDDDLIR